MRAPPRTREAHAPPHSAAWRAGDIRLCYSAAPHRPGAYQDGRGESTVRVASWAAAVEHGLAGGDGPTDWRAPVRRAWLACAPRMLPAGLASKPGLASWPARLLAG